MKVLFIGGTGVISSACARLALERGIELYLLNRGQSTRPLPKGARHLRGDIRRPDQAAGLIGDQVFDAVVDWIAFTPAHIEADLELLRGKTGHWEYSRNKIACEQRLMQAYRQEKFPVTIVRPSHTYDQTLLPMHGGYTMVDRMRKGKPVIVHGDGTSLWVLTHHADFARGFVGLLGNSHAIGDAFQITSDEWLNWNQIYNLLAQAAGVEPRLVHVPSELIAAYDPVWGAGLLGDKSCSMVFDNSKIKRVVPDFVASIPFAQGAREIIRWYDADPARRQVDQAFDVIIERILAGYQKAWP
ncbi:MAG: NAD-dependent epimerase/dehydratase family protein [Anaerolineales bacterium]